MKQLVRNPLFNVMAYSNILVSVFALAAAGFYTDSAIENDLHDVELTTRCIFLLEVTSSPTQTIREKPIPSQEKPWGSTQTNCIYFLEMPLK